MPSSALGSFYEVVVSLIEMCLCFPGFFVVIVSSFYICWKCCAWLEVVNKILIPQRTMGHVVALYVFSRHCSKNSTCAFGDSSKIYTRFYSVLIGIIHVKSCRGNRQLINIVASLDCGCVSWLVRVWYISVIIVVNFTGIKPRCTYFGSGCICARYM